MKYVLFLVIAFTLLSCKDDEVTEERQLARIEINSSDGSTLELGSTTTTLSISGFDQFDDPININTSVQWSSNNANVTVTQTGIVTPLSVGISIITAMVDGVSDTIEILVVDDIPPLELTRIEITSSEGNQIGLRNGVTSLTVNGFDQFDDPFTITSTISWSSDNGNIAIDQNGMTTAQNAGISVITASVDDLEDTFEITVIDNTLPAGTEIYVSDAGNFNNPPWQILKYDENGENPEVFIDEELAWPQDILFIEDQSVVLISNLNTGRITKHNAETGSFIEDFANGIGGPTRMKIGPDNLLYVIQWAGSGLVLRYQLDGTFVDEFTSVGVNQSIGIDWDGAGNLYISSFGDKTVRKFDSTGQDLGLFINTGTLDGPTDIWFSESGELYVLDWSGGAVRKYDSNGNFIETFISGLSQSEGVDFLPNGNILIGNGGTAAVKFYTQDGSYTEDIVSSGSGGLIRPNAVVLRN